MLTGEDKLSLINYKKQKAYDCLREAECVAEMGFWNLAGNRLYYAAFHMASALLLVKGMSARSHGGVIHLIGSEFVKRGLLSKSSGHLLSRLYELRQSGDYDDMYNATEEEIMPFITRTKEFVKEMEELIKLKAKN